MAELLAVQLHIPIHPDVSTSRSKYQKSASGGSTPSNNSSRFEQFAHLPSRRAVDIEYRDLTYRVREGRHKGLYKMFKTSQPLFQQFSKYVPKVGQWKCLQRQVMMSSFYFLKLKQIIFFNIYFYQIKELIILSLF